MGNKILDCLRVCYNIQNLNNSKNNATCFNSIYAKNNWETTKSHTKISFDKKLNILMGLSRLKSFKKDMKRIKKDFGKSI